MNASADTTSQRCPSTTEDRYYWVMACLAELIWDVGGAEEALVALAGILTESSARSRDAWT